MLLASTSPCPLASTDLGVMPPVNRSICCKAVADDGCCWRAALEFAAAPVVLLLVRLDTGAPCASAAPGLRACHSATAEVARTRHTIATNASAARLRRT